MATAAPEATEVVEEEPKKKKPIVLIIGGVVGLIVLIVAIVMGTLFFTGYFNPKPVAEPEHAEADAHGDKKDDKKDKGDQGQNPQPKPNDVSKQKIEIWLKAVNNDVKKVQDKVNAQNATAPVKNEKDW